jgi:hypothetical protein
MLVCKTKIGLIIEILIVILFFLVFGIFVLIFIIGLGAKKICSEIAILEDLIIDKVVKWENKK